MIINRHNYEEFFLLLADGELSDAEQETVLLFAKQHPDLEEELELLMDCRLDAEVPPIYPKEKLLKPISWDVEAPDEMQVQLLNLLDDELSPADKLAIEQQIALDKSLQLEWETLRLHGKLPAEQAPVFPKEKILKPTIWNVDEPDTVFVQMLDLLDNELPAGKKLELEQLIETNKGLQVEWETLKKHGKLEIEPAPAFPKEKLLKPTIWNIENPEAIQLQMLALLDDEISGHEKLELERKIAADAGLQIEWNSLQKARLVAETVVFPNKKDLYKNKETRKIGLWVRWAVAAMLLGFGFYMMVPKSGETGTGTTLASNEQADGSSQTAPNSTGSKQPITKDTATIASNQNTQTQQSITNQTSNNASIPATSDIQEPGDTQTSNTMATPMYTNTQSNKQQTRTAKSRNNTLLGQDNGVNNNNGTDNQTIALADNSGDENRETPILKRTITGSATDQP